MSHPLHRKIGNYLKHFENDYTVILDPACGGKSNIPFFINKNKGNDTEICNVDALLIQDEKVKVVVEIEEASILPTQICGKLLTTSLAKYCFHSSLKNSPILIEDILFLQVLDDSKLPEKSKKKIQVEKIREKILANRFLATKTPISTYKILWRSVIENDGHQLIDIIENF